MRASPAHISLPVTSLASSTPIDGATPTPTVPTIWAITRTISVRRWISRTVVAFISDTTCILEKIVRCRLFGEKDNGYKKREQDGLARRAQ